MRKVKIYSIIFLLFGRIAFACDTCKLRQPKLTQGWTHGIGPESNWDWFIVGMIALITLFTLFFSVKFLLKPGEKNKKHIKNSILNF